MRQSVACLLLVVPAILLGQTMPLPTTPTPATAEPATATSTPETPREPPPSGVEIQIGIGSRIGRDVSNYQVNNGILSQTNVGKATPQLLTGLGFQFCEAPSPGGSTDHGTQTGSRSRFCSNSVGKLLGVFVSVQFGSGSNQTISGYSIGGTVKLGSHLRFMAGFSEMPIGEIAPGFAKAASAYVKKNADLFPGVSPDQLALGGNAPRGTFDGIQTTATQPVAGAAPNAVIYYPGSVMETHYRGGFLVGISMPINIFNLFKGNGN